MFAPYPRTCPHGGDTLRFQNPLCSLRFVVVLPLGYFFERRDDAKGDEMPIVRRGSKQIDCQRVGSGGVKIDLDVDQTILDDDGNLIASVREDLVKLNARGMTLQLWSKGGADYARETAEKFNLGEFLSAYAANQCISY